MKKALGIVAGVVVLAGIGAGIWLYTSLDRIVARAIERFGTEAVGTPVHVGSVELALREGRGTIGSLRVENPEGFADRSLLGFDELTLRIDPASVRGSPVFLPEIRLIGARLVLEARDDGTTNLDVLRRRVRSSEAAGEPGDGAGGSEDVRIRVGSLVVERGTLVIGLPREEGEPPRELEMPSFRLDDLGGREGAPPAELAREVADALTRQFARRAAQQRIRTAIEDEIDERLGGPEAEAAKGLLRSLTGGDD